MAEFKGTKGKWAINGHPYFDEDSGNIGAYNIATENQEQTIAAVHAYKFWGQTLETAQANALLISKAPEMLEMLIDAKQVLEDAGFNVEQLIKEATEI